MFWFFQERDFDKHVNYCQTEPEAQEFLERNYEVNEYFEVRRQKFCFDQEYYIILIYLDGFNTRKICLYVI